MKDSLANLPQRKKGELARITSIIRDSAPQELKYLSRCVELLKEQTETSCHPEAQPNGAKALFRDV